MTKLFALPCKKIRDSLGFRIPRRGFRIQGNGSQVLCQWNLDSGFPSLVDSKSQDSGYFHKQIFQDYGFHKFAGFRNLDSFHGAILCIKQLHTTVSHKHFWWWIEMNHVYLWIINVCMRLWENLTNFMFLNFLEIPRSFLKGNLRSSSKVWNS